MIQISLPSKPRSHKSLPLTLIELNDWVLIHVVGKDSKTYLQNQITGDITQINKHQHLLVAHCNFKGKMWSNLHLFKRSNGFSFIERRSVSSKQLTEMKKYSLFSKVEFLVDYNSILLGLTGFQARKAISHIFAELPTFEKPVYTDGISTILWFQYPTERFLLITDIKIANLIAKSLQNKAIFHNSEQWLALNIEAGIPVIDSINSGKFIPQAANMDILGGISFKKGCYIGQEIITRIQFRKSNKQSMWCLAGIPSRLPLIGENLEVKKGNIRQLTGTVLASVRLNDNTALVQAILNKDTELNHLFYVHGDNEENMLKIKKLPYSI